MLGDLWQWALRRNAPEQDDLGTFWRQTVRWLIAEAPRRVELKIDEAKAGDEIVRIHATARTKDFLADDNASIELTITRPNGESSQLLADPGDTEAGQYVAEYWPQEPGGYRVSARVITGEGDIVLPHDAGWVRAPHEQEFQQLELNRSWLTQLAQQTNGRVVDPDDIGNFAKYLRRRDVPVTEQWVAPLWHQAWVLALALFCLCAEWGLRRWKGLS
jgi:hypothetical protein